MHKKKHCYEKPLRIAALQGGTKVHRVVLNG